MPPENLREKRENNIKQIHFWDGVRRIFSKKNGTSPVLGSRSGGVGSGRAGPGRAGSPFSFFYSIYKRAARAIIHYILYIIYYI